MIISSLDNKKVKELTKLHQKKYRKDQYLLTEDSLLRYAFERGYLDLLIYAGEMPFAFDNVLEVSRDVLCKIAKRDDVDYIGVAHVIKESDSHGDRIVILDHLQDPLNIGRIMECCCLFGFDSMILSPDCADIYNEKCLANSKGGIYSLNISVKDLEQEIPALQEKGYKVYATGLRDNTKELHEVAAHEKMAIVLGNEGSGVTANVMNMADEIIKIDMRNIDSLNVGMAAAIIMYQFKI